MDIYYLSLNCNNWCSEDNYLMRFLTPERTAKIRKYINISDKKLSLYAALLTRMILAQKTGCTVNDLKFVAEDNHKPRIITANNIDFSFSHTHGAILLAVSHTNPVGADIELCRNTPDEIMRYVFHPSEISYINAADGDVRTERFYEIWTQKEAYTKMHGIGLGCDFLSINVLSNIPDGYFHTWKQGPYMCSVCSSNNFSGKEFHSLDEQAVKAYFRNLKLRT